MSATPKSQQQPIVFVVDDDISAHESMESYQSQSANVNGVQIHYLTSGTQIYYKDWGFDSLRGDPRFQAVLKKFDLPK